MISNLPVRQEQSASYRTAVKSSLVLALRAAFNSGYKDVQFRNLRIDPEFSLTRVTWPAIYIKFVEGDVRSAGIGHVEYFPDPNGFMRKWNHTLFDGFIEFDIVTESPQDRDVLADALVEVLRFGTLDTALNAFFTGIYGNVSDQYSSLAVMHQIALDTDHVQPGGDSYGPVPWGAEDLLLYQTSYSVAILGGYYNTFPQIAKIDLITSIHQLPYLEGTPAPDPNDVIWTPTVDYFDDLTVVAGYAHFPSVDDSLNDLSTAKGVAKITAAEEADLVDQATVVAIGHPTFAEVVPHAIDAAIASGVTVFTSVDARASVEAQTLTSASVPSAADAYGAVDATTITTVEASSSVESTDYADTATETGTSATTTSEQVTFTDSGTV